MGTSISVSSLQQDEVNGRKTSILNKPRLMVAAFGFKLVKQKSSKNGNPHPPPSQTTNFNVAEDSKAASKNCPSQPGETEKPEQTERAEDVQENPPDRRILEPPVHIVVQASTGELLLCLGRFLRRRCVRICYLTSNEVISWVRNVDRTLLLQGWQDQGFISPPILVFLYLLCRDTVSDDISSPAELRAVLLTCLYLTYSYLGTEISYPLQPFAIDADRDAFWTRALGVIEKLGADMLRINAEPRFLSELTQELRDEGEPREKNVLER